ncbi:3-oxoacyl-[acyl-carrier protein] reductase [Indibacter alkaliphilus LW1]|jgi:3-oxoacyl-[acyl-carrier protein] reductase|uniref:3-oxoacyl-[acyl-carrier protein] reductase n=1 Tax=Indibacter alkaliphilus (strain CCUG 57479 / KCTC 22604 / LW1) TaxID=1189612 RepID=S2E2M5_INDAL|nr:SDR family oxidoreductase [Indibacter alkaliphilus]EOZ98736.1 3-oxoacyl-[acyl-carrier protein] reductase [Indibacter alkaliphilus LW1]
MQNIANKTAFITGGSKGIGYGIAAALMEQGMRVAITSRSQEAADKAAAELNKIGKGEALGLEADVRDFASQQKAVQTMMDKWGQLDLLVANAGIGHFASIQEMSHEQWHETIDTNLTGVFNSIKAGLEALKQSKGYFITISSLAGTNFFAKGSAYNASKFGLTGFTQAVMLDLRNEGIRCTTIMPGSVATYFNDHVPNEADSWKIQIEDLGKMVVDLMQMHPRTLPSKIEVRPSIPG